MYQRYYNEIYNNSKSVILFGIRLNSNRVRKLNFDAPHITFDLME